jgi:4-hydroxy-2-oxoheptanedioate aldolase
VADGVDGLFIGPVDLEASLGCLGDPMHPKVRAKIGDTIKRIQDAGRPVGILAPHPQFATNCRELGSIFTAVGIGSSILVKATDTLARSYASPKL